MHIMQIYLPWRRCSLLSQKCMIFSNMVTRLARWHHHMQLILRDNQQHLHVRYCNDDAISNNECSPQWEDEIWQRYIQLMLDVLFWSDSFLNSHKTCYSLALTTSLKVQKNSTDSFKNRWASVYQTGWVTNKATSSCSKTCRSIVLPLVLYECCYGIPPKMPIHFEFPYWQKVFSMKGY